MRWRMLAAPVLALTTTAVAGGNAPAPAPSPSAAAAQAKSKKPRSHKANGLIQAYDDAVHRLTIRDSKGNSTVYELAPDVKVWVGPTSVSTDVLRAKTGAKATLKYTESGGVRTASQVHVAASSTRPKTP